MLRKIFVVLSCVCLLACCAIPCFAVGTGAYKFAPLQFDRVTSSSGNSAWMFNEFGTGSGSFNGDVYSATYDCLSDLTSANVELYGGTTFRLYSLSQIVRVKDLSGYGFYAGIEAELEGTVKISFDIVDLVKINGYWRERTTHVSGTYGVRVDDFFNLGGAIAEMIQLRTNLVYVKLNNLAVDISLVVEDTAPMCDFTIPLGTNPNASYNTWFASYGVQYITEINVDEGNNLDITAWIAYLFANIWTIEILPQYSIGALVSTIIGVLLIIAIIKLFGGGH